MEEPSLRKLLTPSRRLACSGDSCEKELHEDNVVLYGFLIAYLLAIVTVGVFAYRKKRKAAATADSVVGAHFGGSFSAPVLALTTFSTVFSGYTVVGVPQDAYKNGFFSIRWIAAVLMICLMLMTCYPRLRRLAILRGYQSPNDFISDRFRSKPLRVLACLCTCIPQLFYLTVQLVAFSDMLKGITGGAIPFSAAMFIFASIVLGMEFIGGMNGVVLSDAIQSLIMLIGFALLLVVLIGTYGTLYNFAPADCHTLNYIHQESLQEMKETQDIYADPPRCNELFDDVKDPSVCKPFGCIRAAKPSFYENPSAKALAAFTFNIANFAAFPLNPHMIQRAFVAKSDNALRFVMMALLISPWITMVPSIIAGVVTATYSPGWPLALQDETAFVSLGLRLKEDGSFQYTLVAFMYCAAMAGIMSTADSVILGVSNAFSIDILRGLLKPDASPNEVVLFGKLTSLVMTGIGIIMGATIDSSDFMGLVTLQNGILMQILPAFLLGLYYDVSTQAILTGIIFGLIAFGIAAIWIPVDVISVPAPNVGVAVNFLVLCTTQFFTRQCPTSFDEFSEKRWGSSLTQKNIEEVMQGSVEPDKRGRLLALVLLVFCVPWYGFPEANAAGVPAWALASLIVSSVITIVLFQNAWSWRPHPVVESPPAAPTVDNEPRPEEQSENTDMDQVSTEANAPPDDLHGSPTEVGDSPPNVLTSNYIQNRIHDQGSCASNAATTSEDFGTTVKNKSRLQSIQMLMCCPPFGRVIPVQ